MGRQRLLVVSNAQQRYLAVHGKLDRAYDDRLAGQITDEMWSRKSAEWETELQTIRRETAKHEQASRRIKQVAENAGFELHVRSRKSFSYIQKAVRYVRRRQRKRELAGTQGFEPQ